MDIDVSLVRRLLTVQFPHWSKLELTTVDEGGWDNCSFRLGPDKLVRLPSAECYAAQVVKEQVWLPRLSPHLPLPIPEPLALGEPGEGYPWQWSVYRWLEGAPASKTRIADVVEFAGDVARFLVHLRQAPTANGPPPDTGNFHRGGSLRIYDAEVRVALRRIGDRAGAAQEVWDQALECAWRGPPVWLHGDMAPGNLLVRDGCLAAVIDFGLAAVGDPACDLVLAWTFFDGVAREVFREQVGLDTEFWVRARGWALWKALITLAGEPGPDGVEAAGAVLQAVLDDHRAG